MKMVNKNQKVVHIILRQINQLDKEISNFCNSTENFKTSKQKDKVLKPCLLNYTGGRGRTGTSLRTLDFEFGSCSFLNTKIPFYHYYRSFFTL